MTQTSIFMQHLLPNVNLVGNPFDLLEQAVIGNGRSAPWAEANLASDDALDAETCWPC